jgi:hypothetical protein
LYTIPSIDSGLLLRQDLVLSKLGRQLIEQEYLPIFKRHKLGDGDAIARILEKERSDLEPDGKHSAVFDAVAEVMSVRTHKGERAIYHESLVRGGREGERTGWQPRFAELVEKHLDAGEFDADSLNRLITAASKKEADAPLAHHLERIKHLEAVLVAMANLFGFLQDRDRAVVADISEDIRSQWSRGLKHINVRAIEEMQADITKEYEDTATGKRFVDFAEALHTGSFDDAVTLVLDQNRFVMNARNKSQPWIQVSGKKLQVRYRDESQIELAPPKELARAWRNGFYLNPLKQVSDELRKSA